MPDSGATPERSPASCSVSGAGQEGIELAMNELLSGKVTEMESSGQTYPLAVNPQDHTSHFTIGNPEYNLAFQITPGLAARLFIDVAVWSDHWDWPVWFPQIAVTLPPDGATFGITGSF